MLLPRRCCFPVLARRALAQATLTAYDAKRLLASFHRLDGDGSGRIELDEFAAALGLQDAPAGYVQRLFSFFDADGAGDISFAELVQGLAVLSPSCSMEEKLKLAFLTCDMDASGGVSLHNLQGVIEYAVARDVSNSSSTKCTYIDTFCRAHTQDATNATHVQLITRGVDPSVRVIRIRTPRRAL